MTIIIDDNFKLDDIIIANIACGVLSYYSFLIRSKNNPSMFFSVADILSTSENDAQNYLSTKFMCNKNDIIINKIEKVKFIIK